MGYWTNAGYVSDPPPEQKQAGGYTYSSTFTPPQMGHIAPGVYGGGSYNTGSGSQGGSSGGGFSGGGGGGGGGYSISPRSNDLQGGQVVSIKPNDPTMDPFYQSFLQRQSQRQGEQDRATQQANYAAIVAQMQAMQDRANADNRQRYNDMLGLADQYGVTERGKIRQQSKNASAEASQRLISRGLGNSTIVDSVNSGIREQKQKAIADVDERKAMLKLGIMGDVQQQQPNMSLYAQLLSQAGSLGGYGGALPSGGGTPTPVYSSPMTNSNVSSKAAQEATLRRGVQRVDPKTGRRVTVIA